MFNTNRRTAAIAAASVTGLGLIAVGAAWSPMAASAAATTAAATAQADTVYAVDQVHSGVHFRIRHAGVGFFWGRFDKGDGEFFIDEDNPSNSFFRATIDVASVNTGNEKRDDHLRAADFFNTRQFPQATFESTSFRKASGENKFALEGNLTLMGETRPVTADVTYGGTGSFQGNQVQGFEAVFEIKRSDFGLTTYLAPDGGEDGGLGNTVRLVVGVEGRKQ